MFFVGVEAELPEKVCCRPQVYSKHCSDILYATMPMNLTYQGWVSQNEVPPVCVCVCTGAHAWRPGGTK